MYLIQIVADSTATYCGLRNTETGLALKTA